MTESALPQQRLPPELQQNFDYLEKLSSTLLSTVSAAIPVGVILQWGTGTAPTNWLICDGASVLRATYPTLFGLWGTTYGSADGTHFNLIDLRGRIPVGVDAGAGRVTANNTLAAVAGAEAHTLGTTEIPSHTHTLTDPGHSHSPPASNPNFLTDGAGGTGASITTTGAGYRVASPTADASTGITIANTGGGGGHNNLQPYVCINHIVRAA